MGVGKLDHRGRRPWRRSGGPDTLRNMGTLTEPRAILFDLDGTLVDSVADLTVSVNHTLDSYGADALDPERVRTYIGDGARRLLERCLLARGVEVDVGEALARFRDHYLGQCTRQTGPFPGVDEGLRRLHPLPMAIVTNKPQAMAEKLRDALGWQELLPAVVGAREELPTKPAPDMLTRALEELGVDGGDPRGVWMVGDSANDILSGKSLGCTTVAVSWGFVERSVLDELEPDHLVDHFDELVYGLRPTV